MDDVSTNLTDQRDPEEFADDLREAGVPIPEGSTAWVTGHETHYPDDGTVRVTEVPMPQTKSVDMDAVRANIDPDALKQMQDIGGTWFAYRNEAMDHSQFGHLKFLKCGPGCTFETPPTRLPDMDGAINWPYQLVSTGPVVG